MTFALLVLKVTILVKVICFTLGERRAKPDSCHPYEKVPVLSGCNDRITIEGEMVKDICVFGDNYSSATDVYWRLRLEDRGLILVEINKNYTNFHMDINEDCPSNNCSCRFTSELCIHANLLMNNAIIYCYALINEYASQSTCHLRVEPRPTITVPLNNVRIEEGKTASLECLVTAATIPGWALFTWKKNNYIINLDSHKYNVTTEINPYKNSTNAIKYTLIIYNVLKEDEANYTLFVYYDTGVLKQNDIAGDFFNQTTCALQVDTKATVDDSLLFGVTIPAAFVVVALSVVIIFMYIIFKRKSSRARIRSSSSNSSNASISSTNTPDERSRLLIQKGSESDNIPVGIPIPATNETSTVLPESQVIESDDVFHAGSHRHEVLQSDRPLANNQAAALTSPRGSNDSTKRFLSYRPHMQALKDHVVWKMAHAALDLALKFGISKGKANDLVKSGDGQIEIFRIWLKKGSQTWRKLLSKLRKMDECKLADELQDKLEKKVILEEMLALKPSMHSLYDVIQRVAAYSYKIAIELGLKECYCQMLEANHSNNCVLRCRKIFEEFLKGNSPTWKEVIDAIRNVGFIAIADDIEKQLPEILDEEEIGGASLEHEPLKVDMLILLLTIQPDIRKIPLSDHAYGWLVDAQVIVKRISRLVQFSDDELIKINNPKLEPNHRSLYLARLITCKGIHITVYKKLCDFYCVTHSVQPTAMTSDVHVCSNAASPQSTTVYNTYYNQYTYYGSIPGSSTAASSSPGLVEGNQEMGKAKCFNNPLSHKTIDFFDLVDSKTLAPHLFQNKLITKDDFERVQLLSMTSRDKVTFLYFKLVCLGKYEFEVFMDCLMNATGHAGHEELHRILSPP